MDPEETLGYRIGPSIAAAGYNPSSTGHPPAADVHVGKVPRSLHVKDPL